MATSTSLMRDIPGAIGTVYDSSKASEILSKSKDTTNKTDTINISAKDKGFVINVFGRIESGQFAGVGDQLSCAYEAVVGQDWQTQGGQENGETQCAKNLMKSEDEPSIIWNFPIEMSYMSTNVSGWPRLCITVRDLDRTIVGYGSVYVPTRGGTHVRYCKLFAPLASSVMGNTIAHLSSELPEFYDSRFTSANVGREALRVVSAGVVKVTIMTRISGFQSKGYI